MGIISWIRISRQREDNSHTKRCQGRKFYTTYRGSLLHQRHVRVPLCASHKILSTILLQGHRRQTHYDRTVTTFWRMVTSLHRHRHYWCLSWNPHLGSTLLLRGGSYGPAECSKLQRMLPVSRQSRSTVAKTTICRPIVNFSSHIHVTIRSGTATKPKWCQMVTMLISLFYELYTRAVEEPYYCLYKIYVLDTS